MKMWKTRIISSSLFQWDFNGFFVEKSFTIFPRFVAVQRNLNKEVPGCKVNK